MNKKFRFPALGLSLILLGAGMLLDRLGYINFDWNNIIPIVMIAFGAGLVFRAFVYDERGKVFFGTILFLFGIMTLLIDLHMISRSQDLVLPSSLIIIGLSFIMIFVMDPKEWGVLIPGVILVAFGSTFMLARLGYIYPDDILYAVEMYWPSIFIFTGVGLLLRRGLVKRNPVVKAEAQ